MKEYDKELLEDIRQYKDILKRFATLQESDIEGAYNLMKDAFIVSERWSKIKYDIRKELKRGEGAAFKERVEEMHRYLKEIAVTSRVIWKTAKETLQNYKEI
ncbi:MAG: hypothetical protein KH333_09760 [Clostridium sp.]|nr:hypothetical protein [Clostridium sp.]